MSDTINNDLVLATLQDIKEEIKGLRSELKEQNEKNANMQTSQAVLEQRVMSLESKSNTYSSMWRSITASVLASVIASLLIALIFYLITKSV